MNQSSRYFYGVGCGTLLLAVFLIFRPYGPDSVGSPTIRRDPRQNERTSSIADSKKTIQADPVHTPSLNLNSEMERLKKRWLELGPGNDRLEARDALAIETINALSCSAQMVELIDYLNQQGIATGHSGDFNAMPQSFFTPSNAQRARKALLELSSRDTPWEVIRGWCEFAGKTCPNDEFEAFSSALASIKPEWAGMATLGRNLELVKVDPETAILSTLRVLKEMPDERNYLTRQLESLPPSSNFGKIELGLNELVPDKEHFHNACGYLFKTWGQYDPAAAANYVMNHPERLEASLISDISWRSSSDPRTIIDWVKKFPQGVYMDAAARGAVNAFILDKPDLANESAALIGDPKMRATALSEIEATRKGIEEGDKY